MTVRAPTEVTLSPHRGIILDFPYDVVDSAWNRMNQAFCDVFGDDVTIDWRDDREVEIRPGVKWYVRDVSCLTVTQEP